MKFREGNHTLIRAHIILETKRVKPIRGIPACHLLKSEFLDRIQ